MAWLELGSTEEILALVKSADAKGEPVEVLFHDDYGNVVRSAVVNGVDVWNSGLEDEASDAYWTRDMYNVAEGQWHE